jgi:hypothetical protein
VTAVAAAGDTAAPAPATPVAVRLLAWGPWLAAALFLLTSTAIWAVQGFPILPLSFARGPIGVMALSVAALTFVTVGALLAARMPRNPIGWLLLGIGVMASLVPPVNLLVAQAFDVARPYPPFSIAAAWLLSSLLTPVDLCLLLLVCFLFPDGRPVDRRLWLGVGFACVGASLLAACSALDPTGLLWYPALPNPAALPSAYSRAVGAVRLLAIAFLLVAVALASGSILVRYRRADRRLRVQLRWIVVGVVAMGVGVVPFLLARYLMATSDATGEILVAIGGLGVCCFPLAIAVAIVRTHLYGIDAIISRTLVYIPLMGLLAGMYAASVTLFQRLFISLTGDTSDASFVISSLMLAAVFGPARSALEGHVGRRFKPVGPTHDHDHEATAAKEAGGAPRPATAPDEPTAMAQRIAELERRLAAIEGEVVDRRPRDAGRTVAESLSSSTPTRTTG